MRLESAGRIDMSGIEMRLCQGPSRLQIRDPRCSGAGVVVRMRTRFSLGPGSQICAIDCLAGVLGRK